MYSDMTDEYICERCGDEWGFFPEDYDFIEEDYPTECPFCQMPKIDLFRDVYKEEGLWQAIKEVAKRVWN